MDELAEKQKKERKELQGKIQAIKKAVPKGDKNRKKEANIEIARLEELLSKKHEEDIDILQSSSPENDVDLSEGVQKLRVEEPVQEKQEQKMSKAHRRRNKKAALEKEKAGRIQAESAKNINSARKQEYNTIKSILARNGLVVHEIASDGHCLYKAVSHQLSRHQVKTSVESLRRQTAQYMRSHQDDFIVFLSNPETREPFTAEEYEIYCKDIERTAAWGGQLEINAMSNFLQVPIEVIQAVGPAILTGEEMTHLPVVLSYHRHAYGLGEHYNSVVPSSSVAVPDPGMEGGDFS